MANVVLGGHLFLTIIFSRLFVTLCYQGNKDNLSKFLWRHKWFNFDM